eukprot:2017646-Pyramimonas_sp.AAC.1
MASWGGGRFVAYFLGPRSPGPRPMILSLVVWTGRAAESLVHYARCLLAFSVDCGLWTGAAIQFAGCDNMIIFCLCLLVSAEMETHAIVPA